MKCIITGLHLICSIKWLLLSLWSERKKNGGKQSVDQFCCWTEPYTSFPCQCRFKLKQWSKRRSHFVYKGAFRKTTESPLLGLSSTECDSGGDWYESVVTNITRLGPTEERRTPQSYPSRVAKQTKWKRGSKYINLCSSPDIASCKQPICCQQTCSFIQSAPKKTAAVSPPPLHGGFVFLCLLSFMRIL